MKAKIARQMITACALMILLLISTAVIAQNKTMPANDTAPRMDWWRKARFAMFIHWGVYAVPAGRYHGKTVEGFYDGKVVPSAGEWIMHDAKIPRAEYQQFAKQFNPVEFNPDNWVSMAKEAGMKYIVITSKHHDGFALFNSQASDWNVVKATPYGKDIIKQLAEACRKQGMKLGLYYSQANDWNNPGGAAEGGHWDSTQNGSMDEYIKKVAVPQVKEILENYGDIAELWWDVPTGMTKQRAAAFLPLLKMQPHIITNNRLGGGDKGDIETPEQFIPPTGIPGRDWETCMTMNDTWGYKIDDQNWKSAATLIRNLVDIASKGGNYLLNVGPDALGNFPKPIVERLQAIGKWMKVNSEAIYATHASPFKKLAWGRCTQKVNSDGNTTLYLHVFKWPANGILQVPEIKTNVNSAVLLATGKALKKTLTGDGLTLQVGKEAPDSVVSVIKILLNGVLKIDSFPISAGTNGDFVLGAEMADLHNQDSTTEQVFFEGDDTIHIAYWSDPKNWVSWNIHVTRPGIFTVKAVAAIPETPGKMTIKIGDQQITTTIKNTGGYQNFKPFILGKINIPKPGDYQVAVHPVTEQWKPLNLQQLSLTH